MGLMRTVSGRIVDPLDLHPDDVSIIDIAHALSMINRYGGHVGKPYSVAEHSIYVSKRIESLGYSTDFQLAGLLHDASEAYVADLPRPIKRDVMLKGYVDIELAVQDVLHTRFSLVVNFDDPVIDAADDFVLEAEQCSFRDYGGSMDYVGAKCEFLRRFTMLCFEQDEFKLELNG